MVLERSNSEVRRLSAVYLVLQGYQGLLLLLLYSKMLAEVVHILESDWLYLVLNLQGVLAHNRQLESSCFIDPVINTEFSSRAAPPCFVDAFKSKNDKISYISSLYLQKNKS